MKKVALKRAVLSFAAIALSLCVANTAAAIDTELKITAIDIYAQGDATMLESKGERLLMDTGSKSYEKNSVVYDTRLFNYLESENITSFDIYISHFHDDHYGNILDIINNSHYSVGTIYLPTLPDLYTEEGIRGYINEITDTSLKSEATTALAHFKTSALDKLIRIAGEKGINIVKLKKGDTFNLGDAKIDILGPDAGCFFTIQQFASLDNPLGNWLNNASLAARVTVDKTVFLTLGDTEIDEEACLIRSGQNLKADILKISHHGSGRISSAEYLQAVSPTYTYLQVYGNSATIAKNYDAFTRTNSMANVNATAWNGQITYTITNNAINVDTKRHNKTITIESYDENNQLIATETAMPDEGTNYFLESRAKRSIDGYTYQSTTGETTGVATGDKIIKSYYKKNADTTPEEGETVDPETPTEPEMPISNPNTADNISLLLIIVVMCSAVTIFGYFKLTRRQQG